MYKFFFPLWICNFIACIYVYFMLMGMPILNFLRRMNKIHVILYYLILILILFHDVNNLMHFKFCNLSVC